MSESRGRLTDHEREELVGTVARALAWDWQPGMQATHTRNARAIVAELERARFEGACIVRATKKVTRVEDAA